MQPSELRCSFCNKSQYAVQKLIAAPTVFICDECVGACVDILDEDKRDKLEKSPSDQDRELLRHRYASSARKLTAAEAETLIDALNCEFEEAGASSEAMTEVEAYRDTIAHEPIQDLTNYFVLIGRLRERSRPRT